MSSATIQRTKQQGAVGDRFIGRCLDPATQWSAWAFNQDAVHHKPMVVKLTLSSLLSPLSPHRASDGSGPDLRRD
ncbi:MAG: hypothetical protein UZ07_CHB004000155 [Chlorobi bacterium OLB7]|nr:MAG: hypothetical protein UZ07_CHB004000155 [Chlorobi bacterium OLB7]